jgi:hypothetical protein
MGNTEILQNENKNSIGHGIWQEIVNNVENEKYTL